MGIKKELHEGEEIHFVVHPGLSNYLVYYTTGIFIPIISGVVSVFFIREYITQLLAVGMFLGFIILTEAEYWRRTKTYYITNKRVIQEEGWINKKIMSAVYRNIADVTLKQTIIQRIFNTGDVLLNTKGGRSSEIVLKGVRWPRKIRNKIEEEINNLRE